MTVNAQIFRQYDIRGIVGTDLTEEILYLIGRGFGTFLRRKNLKSVVIGGDARPSTPEFKEQFTNGLLESGCDVVDVGLCATPVLYFAIWKLEVEAGAMITASHNPSEYNGIKLNEGLASVYGEQIQEILGLIQERDFVDGKGSFKTFEGIIDVYSDFVVDNIKLKRPIKCVVDAGNGAGGNILPNILKRMGCEVKEMYCEVDGTFPNHHPDPTIEEYMTDLIEVMKKGEYEVGFGLDGDADRIGIIDEKGKMLYGDQILNIFARDFLADNPGETVLADVKCSKTLFDDIKKHGGKPMMYKTGHANIKNKMKADSIKFGGEMSGHIFFADRYFGFDDAMYACCRFAEIIAKSDLKTSEMLADQPKTYSTPELRYEVEEETKFETVEKVRDYFISEGYDVNTTDGMRVTFDDGWGLIRASNTQPVLVLRFEAETQDRLDEIQSLIEGKLKDFC
ncbi:MAG: phosphomannomutase/phosphoglucomutase [Candidatus Cloacimonadales bacterium]|jgi:phosphomannomutase/phosphoglucomutase|nr:phosphomannomutase/phosphoglucomutase [Candidatus Cloacimonadota bacterium]MDD2650376.1 phosphomannomutase/phosphoglucomutase [Candidatus Cloacimonadota bacterium]MDX9977942.1 phosphomannomutase/phosphoglucomutase [Candidatus Cloacimonadales bacterium]